MATQKLRYEIGFAANTQELKRQLQQVKIDLNNLSNLKIDGGFGTITTDLNEAALAARQLSGYLEQATDKTTGKLNLNDFRKSIQASGISLQDYANKLSAIGPQGQKAFLQVAGAVLQADTQVRRSNAALDKMWTTLTNTVRWQISTAAINTFTGAISSAYNYSKDLNESLTNIRIVTGKSVAEMKDFAKYANQAAKQLSTTTTEYTDAALIYYQQGLNEEQVKERTNITIDLANVSGQSAQEVSDQMTAIWNNFDNGSKSLEYYADVLTALGAATASSTEEISQGLEKFAATAETVGLSYEYATAALATVTATTRQSADVVGTAFKTLFSRLEGLQLGETLDDGTTLNKYSQALATAGVNIKDTNGQLKDMDKILDELGARWASLGKDQQVALAQTVGGIRQYTQLIALMDNWSYFQENLQTAMTAEGTVDEQAKIYAESWEAARDRVTAATETIYQTLINDEFFIDLADFGEGFLGVLNNIIDAMGGFKGTLLLVSNIFMTTFNDKISMGVLNLYRGVVNLGKGFKSAAVSSAQLNQQLKSEMLKVAETNMRSGKISGQDYANLTAMVDQAERNKEILELEGKISQEDINQLQYLNEHIALLVKQKALLEQIASEEGWSVDKESDAIASEAAIRAQENSNGAFGINDFSKNADNVKQINAALQAIGKTAHKTGVAVGTLYDDFVELSGARNTLQSLKASFGDVDKSAKLSGTQLKNINAVFNDLGIEALETGATFEDFEAKINTLNLGSQSLRDMLRQIFQKQAQQGNFADEELKKIETALDNVGESAQSTIAQLLGIERAIKKGTDAYDKFQEKSQRSIKNANSFTGIFSGIMQISQSITALTSFMQALGDETLSTGDKLTQLLTTVGMFGFSVISLAPTVKSSCQAIKAGFAAAGKETVAAGVAGAAAWGWVTIIAIALAAAIGIAAAIAKANEEKLKQNKELVESEKAILDAKQEELKTNQKLISSMEDLLEQYQKDKTVKAELDDATDKLTEAYDIEGAALAKLSGRYEDYIELIKQAQGKTVDQYNEAADSYDKLRSLYAGNVLAEAVHETKGNYANNKTAIDVDVLGGGHGNTPFAKIIKNKLESAGWEPGEDYQLVSGGNIRILKANADSLVDIYDILTQASSEFFNSDSFKAGDKSYRHTIEWLEAMKEDIELYRSITEDALYNEAAGSVLGSISEATTQKTFDNWYKNQIKELTGENYNYSEKEAMAAIQAAISESGNTTWNDFLTNYTARAELEKIIKDSGSELTNVEKIIKDYDINTLAAIENWSFVTDANFKYVYAAAEKYREGLDNLAEAQERLNIISKDFEDFDGSLTMEIVDSLRALIIELDDSGEETAKSLEEYEKVLRMSDRQRKEYVRSLELTSMMQKLDANLAMELADTAMKSIAQSWVTEDKQANIQQNIVDAQQSVDLIRIPAEYYQKGTYAKTAIEEIGDYLGFNNLTEVIASEGLAFSNDMQRATTLFDRLMTGNAKSTTDSRTAKRKSVTELFGDNVSPLEQYVYDELLEIEDNKLNEWARKGDSPLFKALTGNYLTDQQLDMIWSYQEGLQEAIKAEETYNKLVDYAKDNLLTQNELLEYQIGLQEVLAKQAEYRLEDAEKLGNAYEAFGEGVQSFDGTNYTIGLQQAQTLMEAFPELATKFDWTDAATGALGIAKEELKNFLELAEDGTINVAKIERAENIKTQIERLTLLSDYYKAIKENDTELQEEKRKALKEMPPDWLTENLPTDYTEFLASEIAQNGLEIVAAEEEVSDTAEDTADTVEGEFADIEVAGTSAAEHLKTEFQSFTESAVKNIGLIQKAINQLKTDEPIDWDSLIKEPTANKTSSTHFIKPPAHVIPIAITADGGTSKKKPNLPPLKEQAVSTTTTEQDSETPITGLSDSSTTSNDDIDQIINAIDQEIARLTDEYTVLMYPAINAAATLAETLNMTVEEVNELIDAYHELNRVVKNLEREYERLERNLSQTTSLRERAKLYDDILTNLDAQIDKQEKIANLSQKLIGGSLETELNELGFTIGSDGEISNYGDILTKLSKDTSDEGKEIFDNATNLLKKYEEYLDTQREAEDRVEELRLERQEQFVNSLTDKLKLTLDFNDVDKAAKRFSSQVAEALGNSAKSFQYEEEIARRNLGLINGDASWQSGDYVNQFMSLLVNQENMTPEQYRQALEDLQGNVIATGEEMLDFVETLQNRFPDALKKAKESFNQFTNQLAHNKTILDTIKELYSLQGITNKTTEGYNSMQRLSAEKLEASVAESRMHRQWLDGATQALEQAQNALGQVSEGDPAYQMLKEARDALLEEFNSAQEAMLSSAKDALEIARDMYMAAIEKAAVDFEQAVTDNLGFDFLQTRYDNYIDSSERYLDSVNALYEVNKLNRAIEQSIDKSNSSYAAAQLKALQQEIALREQDGKLSQYEVDLLNAKYDMTLKQIALEESQNAKTQMRLQRDNQGNWNYVYTADTEAISNAEQELSDAQNKYYNLSKEQVSQTTSEILKLQQDVQQSLDEIWQDTNLSIEEKLARSQELYEYYTQKAKDLEADKYQAISDMTEAGSLVIKDFENTYGEALNDMTTSSADFEAALNEYLGFAEDTMRNYENTVTDVTFNTGTSFNDLQGDIQQVSDSTTVMDAIFNSAVNNMWNKIPSINDVAGSYAALAREMMGAAQAAAELARNLALQIGYSYELPGLDAGNNWIDVEEPQESITEEEEEPLLYSTRKSISSSNNSTSSLTYDDGYSAGWNWAAQGNRSSNPNPDTTNDAFNRGFVAGYNKYIAMASAGGGGFNRDVLTRSASNRFSYIAFDNGGYTGEFAGGRFAMLHEKELVLKQEDTRNVLAAVNAMRSLDPGVLSQLIAALDGNAAASSGLMAARLGGTGISSGSPHEVIQHVDINANFPGVQSAAEIEQALHNIVNEAAQYASINKD